MNINTTVCPYPVDRALKTIVETEIAQYGKNCEHGIVIRFRDVDYDSEKGGYHPVEIRISAANTIEYITDFAYVGSGPFTELAKEIDFDFSLSIFQHHGRSYPIARGRQLYRLWEQNFICYYEMGVYSVTVEGG